MVRITACCSCPVAAFRALTCTYIDGLALQAVVTHVPRQVS
jgi:hypothetical protein